MGKCLKCQSEKIVANAKVLDRGDSNYSHDFQIAVDEKPDALIFKERNYSYVSANVCGACGFIEFYAEEPSALYEAYLRAQERANG